MLGWKESTDNAKRDGDFSSRVSVRWYMLPPREQTRSLCGQESRRGAATRTPRFCVAIPPVAAAGRPRQTVGPERFNLTGGQSRGCKQMPSSGACAIDIHPEVGLEATFRLRRSDRNLALGCLLGFVAWGTLAIFIACSMPRESSIESSPLPCSLAFRLFMAGLCLWTLGGLLASIIDDPRDAGSDPGRFSAQGDRPYGRD